MTTSGKVVTDESGEKSRRDESASVASFRAAFAEIGLLGVVRNRLRAIAKDSSVRSATFAFLLTRILILFFFIIAAQMHIGYSSVPGEDGGSTTITLNRVQLWRIIQARELYGDSGWYRAIAEGGYERRPFTNDRQARWAFFPLFPLVWHLASRITGEYPFSGLAVSAVSFFLALVLLHKTVIRFGWDIGDANRTVLYVAIFPVSYFFTLPVPESLFLFLTVASFYAARREAWVIAALLGAMASATRFAGLILLPALLLMYWLTYRTLRPSLNLVSLLLIPTGLITFMLFLRRITGDPLAFARIGVAWGRKPGFFLRPFVTYLSDPLLLASPWDFRIINFLAAALILICGLVLLKWRRWSLAFFALGSTFLALSSTQLQSQARYAMVVFPAFIVLGVAGRNPRFDLVFRTVSLILLVLLSIMFSLRLDVALS